MLFIDSEQIQPRQLHVDGGVCCPKRRLKDPEWDAGTSKPSQIGYRNIQAASVRRAAAHKNFVQSA